MPRTIAPIAVLALLVAVVAALTGGARAAQLLTNPGFEDGTAGWSSIDAELYPSNRTRSGAGALEVVSPGHEAAVDVYQWMPIRPGAAYEFSGWVFLDDPNAERAFLRISWFSAQNDLVSSEDSEWLTGSFAGYRFLTTNNRVAPPNAETARVSVTVLALGPMSVFLDDFSLEGPEPGAETPTQPPTPSPPPAPTASGSPTIVATPTPSATATPTPVLPTSSAPATSTPPPGTPTTPATASTSPPSAPATSSTVTPVATSSSPAVTSPPASGTPRPTPRPSEPPPTADEPAVFNSLTNGGFEALRPDGTAYGWRKIGGTIGSTTSPVRNGGRALLMVSSGTTSTKWAYQTVSIAGGQHYEASVYAWKNDANIDEAFLRISWYASPDGSGEAISTDDSTQVLAENATAFQRLSTGPVQAPPGAQSARVRLMLRPAGAAEGRVVFDDAAFSETDAPAPTPTATPVPSTAPTPTAPGSTPVPTSTPATATQTASPTVSITSSPTPAPTATAAPEPEVFELLTNGGFEVAREDQTPYGWHKVGGEMAVSDGYRVEGDLSLAFTSASTSTKWVYQAVSVQSGEHYQVSAWVLAGSGVEAELRVSWYASQDGSGTALATEESEPLVGGRVEFQTLVTGALQAPAEAHSARVRLLIRPDSSSPRTVFFDGVTMAQAQPGSSTDATSAPASQGRPARAVLGAQSSPLTSGGSGGTTANDADLLPPTHALIRPANIRPAATPEREAAGLEGAADGTAGWLIAMTLGIPAIGIASVLGLDAVQRGRRPE